MSEQRIASFGPTTMALLKKEEEGSGAENRSAKLWAWKKGSLVAA